MPSDPVIVPPTPTVNQGEKLVPGDDSPGIEQVQAVFDRIMPPPKGSEAPRPEPAPPPPPPATTTPEAPTTTPPAPAEPQKPSPEPDRKLPSFLEEALKVDGSQPKTTDDGRQTTVEEEWPEELPPAEKQSRIKGLRDAYKNAKAEIAKLQARPVQNEQVTARVQQLETQNREMAAHLSRFGVEQNAEFQQQIIRPLYGAWNEAARIVKDSGGDPEQLARAMSLTGKSQFEALDEIFQEMPESAKAEANEALRTYRRYDQARQAALANAPQTFEVLRKKEMERQYQVLSNQKEDMKSRFDTVLNKLRDEAKLEVLQRSNDPDAAWWNEQADGIINNSRNLYLENTDMDKMAAACILAPAVDAYRKLWLAERAARSKIEGQLKDRFGAEPNLSESGGSSNNLMPDAQMAEDLKKPFKDVFLREFHRSQARSR